MRVRKPLLIALVSVLLVSTAKAQQATTHLNFDSIQKVKTDSALRVMMSDSLGLSTSTITQVFALRDSSVSRSGRIREDNSLTFGQKNAAIQALRSETTDAIKNAMGSTNYRKYLEIILGRKLDD